MAKAPPRDRSAAPLSPQKDQGDNGPKRNLTTLERSAKRLSFTICGVPCGVDQWGVCRLPVGHKTKVHHPARRDEPLPHAEGSADPGWDDDPRHEQEQIHRSVS